MREFWNDYSPIGLICAAIFFSIISGCKVMSYVETKLEAPVWCYDRVGHIREMTSDEHGRNFFPHYTAMIPMINEFAKDKFLSDSECDTMSEFIQEYEEKKKKKKLQEIL